jgi:intraflagellar transport protein 43
MEPSLDLSLSPVKRATAKQGRRAAGRAEDQPEVEEEETFEMAASPLRRPEGGDFLEASGPRASAPPRRTGGWGDEVRARTAKSVFREPVQQADSEDEDLPTIPDLEEVEAEDLALAVAEAPSVAVNRVATYKELDSDLFKHAAFATLEEIDLRLLTRCLAPETELKEADEEWTWDMLFTDVSSELQAEWFPEAEEARPTVSQQDRPYTAFNRFPV